MDETTDNQNISVYPNPTDGIVFVQTVCTPSLPYRIIVCNLLGQTLQETTAQGNATLDLSGFGQGIYLVRIATENGVFVQKVNVRQ